jgi:hypothetical protein
LKLFVSAIAFVSLVGTGASAQVGHLPENSPYQDIETGQQLAFFGGHFGAAKDPVGVAPRAGPMYGLRYEIHVGGPAALMARWAHSNTERNIVDPTKSGAAAQVGKRNVSINLYDINLVLNLTGQKSFHRIVPVVNFGAGIGSCSCKFDPDPYQFGTPFAFSFGGGLRFVPGGRFELRADWNDYLYQLKYPTAYYVAPVVNGTPLANSRQARSFWKNNPAMTLGGSLSFFR